MAYAAVTDTLREESAKQSIENAILRILVNLRLVISETVYMTTGQSKNVHYIVPFQNKMSKRIGVLFIPDPDEVKSVKVEQKNYELFVSKYTPALIIKTVTDAVNQKPRKVPYESLIEWYQSHAPKDLDSYEFLESLFTESGDILPLAIAYFLRGINVLKNTSVAPADPTAKSPLEIPPGEPVPNPPKPPVAVPAPPPVIVAPPVPVPAAVVVPLFDLWANQEEKRDGLPVWGLLFDEGEHQQQLVEMWGELPGDDADLFK
jgi:hypothetical protein